ncbi:hypothetical protein EDC01DRAFT_78639 [Geopyxis carbonaria]|nr:hypothetical protein EDC01DRAFT_78639 [Geopyxis carbonaria]
MARAPPVLTAGAVGRPGLLQKWNGKKLRLHSYGETRSAPFLLKSGNSVAGTARGGRGQRLLGCHGSVCRRYRQYQGLQGQSGGAGSGIVVRLRVVRGSVPCGGRWSSWCATISKKSGCVLSKTANVSLVPVSMMDPFYVRFVPLSIFWAEKSLQCRLLNGQLTC